MNTSLFGLALLSPLSFAESKVDVVSTMKMMEEGMENIQKGFLYNNPELVKQGLASLEKGNNIFQTVDVSTFIPNNKKIGVTKNLNRNMEKGIETLKSAIPHKNISQAVKGYSEIVHSCISCHAIVRGW